MPDYDEILRTLQEDYPLVPYTNAGRLSSTVRRMKAEKELGLPVKLRTGFAISVKYGNAANELDGASWEAFYAELRSELRERYPSLYESIFGDD